MPIRITDDYKIELTQESCPQPPVDFYFSDNVKAVQRILNYATIFYHDYDFKLSSYTPLVVDGVYGSKTKTRIKEIFGGQYLTKCNLYSVLFYLTFKIAGYIPMDDIHQQLFAKKPAVVTPPYFPPGPVTPTPDPESEGTRTGSLAILVILALLIYGIK